MADSEEFGFVNVANLRVAVDKLPALEKFLKLAVDTVIGRRPERVHISGFCVETSYLPRKKPIPKNWIPDGEGGYWENHPSHYWLDVSQEPLEVCTLGSSDRVDLKRVRCGRETFADQADLVKRVMELVSGKTLESDVLPHIPAKQLNGAGINENLLKQVLSRKIPAVFEIEDAPEERMEITGEDLRGIERIGYTLEQVWQNQDLIKVGLCKAYYPK